jgi:NADH dehydrogenase FAD-containing subunit
LVITTGSNSVGDIPWKNLPNGSEPTKASLHKLQKQVAEASSIVLGGGGPTGVESAGELGFEYNGKKEITLITSGENLLIGSMPTNLAQGAEAELVKLGVKIVKNTKITSSNPLPTGQTELTLSSGERMAVDLYLPTVGIIPNSDFIPKELLNDKGEVIVDEYLRVKNATDIWAAGDITDLEPSQIVYADKQAVAMVKNLDLALKGKEPVAYKHGGGRIMGLTLGRSKATGRSGNMKIPSIMIWWFKGRTMGTENLSKYVDGSKF